MQNINLSEEQFTKVLAQITQAGTNRRKAICLAFRASVNACLESKDVARLNAFTTTLAGSTEWPRLRKAIAYMTGGIRLEIQAGRPVFIQAVEASVLVFDAKTKAWSLQASERHAEILALWRENFSKLDYDAINPAQPRKALRIEPLRQAYVRLRNNRTEWDASQRATIQKALDALAPIFED